MNIKYLKLFKKINFSTLFFNTKHNISFINLRSVYFNFFKFKIFSTIRRFVSRKFKKKIKYIKNYNCYKIPFFKKGNFRMGKGIGSFNYWIISILCNQKIFEFSYFKKKKIFIFFLSNLVKKLPNLNFLSY